MVRNCDIMKDRFLLIIVLFFAFSQISFSQPCSIAWISLFSQEDVDNFKLDYPGCNEIDGSIQIQGTDITNLNGLLGLTSVNGSLFIINTLVADLSGLDSLTFAGYLDIS
ncbi:MAG: hypothetical protein CVU14_02125, partial [Bacteroidetes bacterium HGW-Bacteroidetes-9]